jgi:hypothetical protein
MFLPLHALRPLALLLALLLPALPLGGTPSPAAPASQPAPLHRLTDPVADPQQPGVQWFATTGHTLRGAFLQYWTRYGGLAQFGYPLTEEFTESNDPDGKNSLVVQYFERNRFEYHPENAGSPYEVLLGTLGRAFHAADPPDAAPSDPTIRYFPETGHTLQGAFLQYWETHGGLFVHGYPLTEPFPEMNPIDAQTYTVQYFERSRFELHPENAGSPYEVLLGLLGEQLARQNGYFDGMYPRFGHAQDLSWIAGQIYHYEPNDCSAIWCGCSLFAYAGEETRVQLTGAEWSIYSFHRDLPKGTPLVLFGRPLAPAEKFSVCPIDPAPGYKVNEVQGNPIP